MINLLHSPAAPVIRASALFHLRSRRAGLCAALVTLAAPAIGPPPAQAAVTEAWVQRYNNVVNDSWDQAAKMVRDAAGDIVVTGTSGADMMTLKYSGANGSVLWQRRYNGPANGDEGARALAVDSSGNVVVTGFSQNATIAEVGDFDFYTAKYAAADGALLWEKRYHGPVDDNDNTFCHANYKKTQKKS